MIILNFSHPLTRKHLEAIQSITNQNIDRIIVIKAEIDNQRPLYSQLAKIINSIELTSEEWQTLPILINPPGLNYLSAVLIAELHGKMGYFPSIIRLRPVTESVPQAFEVAEIINLQKIRDHTRSTR